MRVSTKLNDGTLTVFFDGELDQSVADSVKNKLDGYLDNAPIRQLVFDMQKLEFMDSTGIGLIMGRYKKMKAKNVQTFIANPNKQIEKVIKISGLYMIIPLLR